MALIIKGNTEERRKRQKWRRSLWRLLPGSRPFNRWIQTVIQGTASSRRGEVAGMECLASDGRALHARIRHFDNQLAAAAVWQTAVGTVLLLGVLSLLGYFFRGTDDPFGLIGRLTAMPNPGGWIFRVGYWAVAGISCVLWFLMVFLPHLAVRKAPYLAFRPLLYGWPAVVLTGYGVAYYLLIRMATSLAPAHAFFAAACINGGILLVYAAVYAVVAFVIIISVFAPFERRTRSMYPAAVIADCLLKILLRVEKSRLSWSDIDFRRPVLRTLERAAVCAETGLYEKLNGSANQSNVILRDMTQKIAAEFRGLKHWVATPLPDTYGNFVRRIKAHLENVCRDNWPGLLQFEEKNTGTAAEKVEEKKPVSVWWRLLKAVRLLVAGAIPFGVLFAITHAGVQLEKPVSTYATVGVYVWAGICLLAIFDPVFIERIRGILKTGKEFKDSFTKEKKDK